MPGLSRADSVGAACQAGTEACEQAGAHVSGADAMTARVEVIGNATLYLGDCLDLLPEAVPAMSASACVTDPPYGINTKSDGMGKLNPWADVCNSAFWYAEWFRVSRSRLRQDGCMWTCLNWRSLATFQKASCDIRWPIES